MFRLRTLCSVLMFALLGGPALADQQPQAPAPPLVPASAPLQRREALQEEIARLQSERAQYGLGLPIVMIGVGGTLAFGGFANAAFANSLGCDPQQCSGNGPDSTGGLLSIGAAGIFLGVWGLSLLGSRREIRNQLGEQIRSKRAELQALETQVSVAPIWSKSSLRGVAVILSF